MTRRVFITILLLTGLLKTRSQTYDTAQFRLDKEQIRLDREAFLKGDLKRPELNLSDWTTVSEKTIKLKNNKFNTLCIYNYKNFMFCFEYEPFKNAVISSTSNYPIMKDFRIMDFKKNDTIDINKYALKAQDENFIIEYLIKLTSEKNLSVYDNKENKLVEKVALKKATWETRTNKSEVTLFYFNNSYVFYRNDRICTSKRFDD